MSVRAGKWGECSEVIADQSRGPNGRGWAGGDGDELEDVQGRSARTPAAVLEEEARWGASGSRKPKEDGAAEGPEGWVVGLWPLPPFPATSPGA